MLSNQQYREEEDNHEAYYDSVVEIIHRKLVAMIVKRAEPQQEQQPPRPLAQAVHQQDENFTLFGRRRRPSSAHATAVATADIAEQAQNELILWQADEDAALLRDDKGRALEHATDYWSRQDRIDPETRRYRWLSLVARAVFAVPSPSGQLERDFGVSGKQLRSERSQTGSANVDMSAFVNCNRQFIELTQCTKLQEDEREEQIPKNICVSLNPFENEAERQNDYINFAALPPASFSNTSIYDGEDGEDSSDDDGEDDYGDDDDE
jgi:hypothetical protein